MRRQDGAQARQQLQELRSGEDVTRRRTVVGPKGPLPVTVADGAARFVPPWIGAYRVTLSGRTETRVAAPPARELDLRPRAASATSDTETLGQRRASVDMSGPLALVLLGLVALEMALRLSSRRRLLAG